MGDTNAFSFSFGSSSSSPSGTENGFGSGSGFMLYSKVRRNKNNNHRCWRRVKANSTEVSGVASDLSSTHQQAPVISSPWIFSIPFEEGTNERNPKESPLVNDTAGDTNTRLSPPSAVTGEIPCYFDGSRYASSSSPLAPTDNPTEKPIKMEKHDRFEQDRSSSQIILVSRILKGIPQSPHFWSLRGWSEVAKQSLINSWDHIFEETIDRIQNIQANGFWVNAKRLWGTLEELQGMGYNVVPLRRKLVELTDVMLRLRTHKTEIRGLKDKAEQHRMAKSSLEYDIVKLKAKVEAEKAGYENVMAKVAKMEDEVPNFYNVFTKLAIKALKLHQRVGRLSIFNV